MDLTNNIVKFLEYCEIDRNLSPNTIKMYDFYLADFKSFLSKYLKKEKQNAQNNYQQNISIINNESLQKYIPKSVIRPNNSEKNRSNRFRNV
jgi:site-specific recombinase XerD